MTLEQVGILLSITVSLFSITSTLGLGIYAFAVLRTMVQQHDKSLESVALQLRMHMADDNKHHNEKASREFEARMDQKFESLEKEIGEVKGYCEDIDMKLNDQISRQARGPHDTQ